MSHEHHDHCGCGCGHDHEHHDHSHHDHEHSHALPKEYHIFTDGALNETAAQLMTLLNTHHFLPCARFLTKSTQESSFTNVSLAPVFLQSGQESVGQLRAIGNVLLGLEHHGYLTIDYDLPLEGFDYAYFKDSAAYRLFEETVAQGAQQHGFLGDIAEIEFGSIAPLN